MFTNILLAYLLAPIGLIGAGLTFRAMCRRSRQREAEVPRSSIVPAQARFARKRSFADGGFADLQGVSPPPINRLRALAVRGDAEAQNTVAAMYYSGELVRQNFGQAVFWYRKAAGQGHAGAQTALGLLYERGSGTPQDYAEALRWYQRAAEQGSTLAFGLLGNLYASGIGAPRDYVQAYKWFHLWTQHPNGVDDDLSVRLRDALVPVMSPEQVAEAKKLASEWKPTR